MNILFKNTKNFTAAQLEKLFSSVNWESCQYPDKLAIAMKNSAYVFSAWHHNKLIGLVNVLDDSAMTAYIHYVLVDPEYQKMGVGKKLINSVKEKYNDYINIVLIAYTSQTGFYENCGFKKEEQVTPIFIKKINL